MNITYEKCGDYLIPNLIPDPEPEGELRKFGLMRKSYLENHRRGIYSGLLLSGELKKHLLMIQEQAEERFDLLVEQIDSRVHTGNAVSDAVVGSPQRRWDLLPSRLIGRDESLGQQGTPSLFSGQSDSGREILPLRGM